MNRATGVLACFAGLVLPAVAWLTPLGALDASAASSAVTDAPNDVASETRSLSIPRADLLRASVATNPEEIVFTAQVSEPVDPLGDASWTTGDTSLTWEIDTGGDALTDFAIDYAVMDTGVGALAVRRARPGAPGGTCPVTAAYQPGVGYQVAVSRSCLGSPVAVSYSVTISWDTNPDDPDSEIAGDSIPDDGRVGPVSVISPARPVSPALSETPATAPTAHTDPAPVANGTTGDRPVPPPPSADPSPTPPVEPLADSRRRPEASHATAPPPTGLIPRRAPAALAQTGRAATRPALGLAGLLLLVGGLAVGGTGRPSRHRQSSITQADSSW